MKKPYIAVIDYGMGNLRSVGKALEAVGARVEVTSSLRRIRGANGVVFPGVGSFKPAIRYVREHGLDDTIREVVSRGTPFLGLCLGFQLMFDWSDEEGRTRGLGLIPGKVIRFSTAGRNKCLTIPHMGWNTVSAAPGAESRMFRGIPRDSYFYFVHSYYCVPADKGVIAGVTPYGGRFCSAVLKDNLWLCQFHPEKSSALGLRLLRNFSHEAGAC